MASIVCRPLSIVEVDPVEEVRYLLKCSGEGLEPVAKDVADFLGAPGAEGLDECGVIPLQVYLDPHEVREVVCELPLALSKGP